MFFKLNFAYLQKSPKNGFTNLETITSSHYIQHATSKEYLNKKKKKKKTKNKYKNLKNINSFYC